MSIAIRSRVLADEVLLALEAYSDGGLDKEKLAEDWSSGLLPRIYDTLNLFALATLSSPAAKVGTEDAGAQATKSSKWPFNPRYGEDWKDTAPQPPEAMAPAKVEREPLTERQVGECIDSVNATSEYSTHHFGWHKQFARAIVRAASLASQETR